MNYKTIFAALIGALALQTTFAGEYCAPEPAPAKCPVDDCCPDIGGNIRVGYDSDYVFKGVRRARDVVWGDVNYTFENIALTPTIGVFHLSSLSSPLPAGSDNWGDETNLYAGIALPSSFGIDARIDYRYFLFPTQRTPAGPMRVGDSLHQVSISVGREIFAGLYASYTRDFLFGGHGDRGFMHTIQLEKTFDISNCIALDLAGGALYNDNYFSYTQGGLPLWNGNTHPGNVGNDSGWHSYFIRAALPIALNCRATVTPYLQYNGTPDGWTADGLMNGNPPMSANTNFNDVFFGGISLSVDF